MSKFDISFTVDLRTVFLLISVIKIRLLKIPRLTERPRDHLSMLAVTVLLVAVFGLSNVLPGDFN